MNIQVVAPSSGSAHHLQFLIATLIDDVIAIDAGALGLMPLDAQRRVQHIFLSHAHLDHVATLPIFLDNVYEPGPQCVSVYGTRATLDVLQQSIFNDRVWPDMVRLSRGSTSFVRLIEIEPYQSVTVGGHTVTPLPLEHVIPTVAFVIDDWASAVAIVSDTAPSEAVWTALRGQARLDALFLECSFPNELAELAGISFHLTPELFAAEYRKLGRELPLYAVHIKPAMYDRVAAQLAALNLPTLKLARPGHVYQI